MSDANEAEPLEKAARAGEAPEDVDHAAATRVADAESAPEPPQPVHDHGDPERAVRRELLWGSDLSTSRLDRDLPEQE
ncbi:hypothetical protein ACIBEJ_05505 [Nonomuraea sp. NPDC050790]|uniref:hypothetical protein n=1 Tax=Nonomuraea sp. NPDC050790 TaxID=3364371 RepID=UPI003793107B